MKLPLWARCGLPVSLLLTTASALAQGLPIISVNPHEHQESRREQTVLKEIRLDRVNPAVAVTGRFSMNQQRAIEGQPGVATPGPACGSGVDFVELSQVPFTIPAGQSSTTIPITFCGDTVMEGNETLSLTIHPESLVGAQCSADGLSCRAQAKIFDSPDFNFDNLLFVRSARGEAGASVITTVPVRIDMETYRSEGFTYSFRTVDGTASSGNPAHFPLGGCSGRDPATGLAVRRDFIPKNGVVSSPANALGQLPIEIQICPNPEPQPEKSFFLQLFDATAPGALVTGRAQVFIQDTPTLTVSDTTVSEPATGRRLVFVTASLQAVPVNPVKISFRTRNGTATAQTGATSICNGVGDYMGVSGGTSTIEAPNKSNVGGFAFVCADAPTERNETFFFELTDPTGKVRLSNSTARVTILDTPLAVGGFQFSPDSARVKVGEISTFSIVWTMPEPQVWRNLNTIEMRIHDDGKDALWVLWKELDNSFSLCRRSSRSSDRAGGRAGRSEDRDDDATRDGIPENGCSAGVQPGTAQVLETKYARLHMDQTTVVGSGPTGQSVTLNLALSFKDKARGDQTISLAASNDMRQADRFVKASSVQVMQRR